MNIEDKIYEGYVALCHAWAEDVIPKNEDWLKHFKELLEYIYYY